MPMRNTNRPSVTTRTTLTGESVSRRMTSRSRATPYAGAITSRTSAMEGHVPSPAWTCSCQYRNAMIMLVAPWAKLNTRVVVYVRTRPDAATAYAAPKKSPVIVYETNMSTSADSAVDKAAAGVGVRRLADPLAADPLDHGEAARGPLPGHVVRRCHLVVRPVVHLAQLGQQC